MDDVVPPRGLCVLVDIIGSVLVDISSDEDVDVVDEELQSVLRKVLFISLFTFSINLLLYNCTL